MVNEPFLARIQVRTSDLDMNGHVTGAAYIQFSDHARWQCVSEAGVTLDGLRAAGLGPVNLEIKVQFLRELRASDAVDISCRFIWGEGKTCRVEQQFHRLDGVLAARVESVSGLLDLNTRRLDPAPAARWRMLAKFPARLGL